MRCIGLTKSKRRCKNNCKFILCRLHKTQWIAIILFTSFVGSYTQDVIKPINEYFNPSVNFDDNINDIISLANKGDAKAQNILGVFALNTENKSQAKKWFLLSAKQENPNAQYNLYKFYINELNGPIDQKKSLYWLKKASINNDADAQYHLGMYYVNGYENLIEINYLEAYKWFNKSIENGSTFAYNDLGIMYKNGEGIKKDINKAVNCFRIGHENKDNEATEHLGWRYYKGDGVILDKKQAYKIWLSGAQRGSSNCQLQVGFMNTNGELGYYDYELALEWFKKSANQGNSDSQRNLGILYLLGTEKIKPDMEKSAYWFEKSAEQGNSLAIMFLNFANKIKSKSKKDIIEREIVLRLLSKNKDKIFKPSEIQEYLDL